TKSRTSLRTLRAFSAAEGSQWSADRTECIWLLLDNLRADAGGDAYRCFVGNVIHDPCFAHQPSFAKYVLCSLYLPGSKVLRINLTQELPSRPGGCGCDYSLGGAGEPEGRALGVAAAHPALAGVDALAP